jgi:hypothetical protein
VCDAVEIADAKALGGEVINAEERCVAMDVWQHPAHVPSPIITVASWNSYEIP